MSKQLSGRPRTWEEATFKVNAANITPDLETGIGKWSDADIKRSLLTGVRPNGTQIAPIMPYGFYKVFTPADVDAVVAYLKSVLAVPNAIEPPIYKAAMHVDTPPRADKAMTEADMTDEADAHPHEAGGQYEKGRGRAHGMVSREPPRRSSVTREGEAFIPLSTRATCAL